MAMVLTEKVRQNIGGIAFRIFEVSGVSGTVAYTLSMGMLGLNYVLWSSYYPKTCAITANSTTYPAMTVAESSAGGTDITLGAHETSGESGTLLVWGN